MSKLIGGMAFPLGVLIVSREKVVAGYHAHGELRRYSRKIGSTGLPQGSMAGLLCLLLEGLRALLHIYQDKDKDFKYVIAGAVTGAVIGLAIRYWGLATLPVMVMANLLLVALAVGLYRWYPPFRTAIQEVRRYHGAEHQVIHTLMEGKPLELAHIRQAAILSPYCGTNLFALSLLLLPLMIWVPAWVFPLLIFLMVPVQGLVLANQEHILSRLALRYGLWVQRFTVAEPEPRHLEAAILAATAIAPGDTSALVRDQGIEP